MKCEIERNEPVAASVHGQAEIPATLALPIGVADQSSSGRELKVRGLGVTFSGELVVACEIEPSSLTARDEWLAVDVEFPDEVRGLLAIASWGDGSVVDAVTAIAVEHLSTACASGGLNGRTPERDSQTGSRGTARLRLSTADVRAALAALPSARAAPALERL